jgi:hypothetical protein
MKESGKPYLIGSYPAISLLQARELHLEARSMLARGINPSSHKRALKQANIQTTQNSFEAVALEWFTRNRDRGSWSESHVHRTISYLTRDVFPWIGKTNINDVKPGGIIKIVQRVEERGGGGAGAYAPT